MAARKVGIIGDGNVGSALARGLKRAGHEVKAMGNDKAAIRDTAAWGEELQKKLPKARVVKTFNTVFAQHMDSGQLDGKPLTAFVAGDDANAKAQALELARDIGFDAVDAGPLKNARLVEPLGYFNIQLGYGMKMGTDTGFRLMHR